MRKRRTSFALAVVLAVTLIFSMLPMSAAAAQTADSKVYVTYQADENGLTIVRQPVNVHPGLAGEYGYTYGTNVKSGDLTALDAIVAAHILKYGNKKADINAKLEVGSSGFMDKAFGSASNVITFVNGAQTHVANGDATFWDNFNGIDSYTGDAVNQAVIKTGDLVEFFTINDTDFYMDNFVWFEKDGTKIEKLNVNIGTKVELVVKGYLNWYALAVPADRAKKTGPIEDAALTKVKVADAGGWNYGEFSDYDNPLDVSGADGKISFTAPQTIGTYYYSLFDNSGDTPLFSPWLEVNVVNKYPVTFNANGGKISGAATKEMIEAQAYGELPSATRSGYKFAGWFTSATGGTKVTASTIVTQHAAHTLYAHWTQTGWHGNSIDHTWKYYINGKAVTGLKNIRQSDGKTYRYYFGADGTMQRGWQRLKHTDGKYYMYYFGIGVNDGRMKTGWQSIEQTDGKNYWYYFGSSATDGRMKTGWQSIRQKDGKTYRYYFATDGTMQRGWQRLKYTDGKRYWYYFGLGVNDGRMKTGWQKIEQKDGKHYFYYFGSSANDGKMKTGWQTIRSASGKKYKYYLGSGPNDGRMRSGTHVINKVRHQFNINGVWLGRK